MIKTNDKVAKLNQSDCFIDVGKIDGEISDYINFDRIEDKSQWFNYLGFDIQLIDRNLIERIPCIQLINNIVNIDRIIILSMPERSSYDWHVDDHRNATLNLLINNHGSSYCMFGKPIDYAKHKIVRLDYEPLHFYLFNTKIDHMVVNHGPQRYMLSMQFTSPLKFDDIKVEIRNQEH